NGKTPIARYYELAEQTPHSDAVHTSYQPKEEHKQEQKNKQEQEQRKLKR
ncbi:IS481 family transposase, partial [Escherichia coli]|nr:IS481 family transposase [Escherichia coli]